MAYFLPVLKSFTITPGVVFDYPFVYYQGVPTSQYPLNLTGATAQLLITDPQSDVLLTLNSGVTAPASGIYFGGQEQDPTNGTIDIVISATDTQVAWQYAKYEMILTTQTLGEQQLLYGSFSVIGFTP